MDAEKTGMKIDRDLLDAVRKCAAKEGRDESEIIEEALRRYLASFDDPERVGSARSGRGESFGDIFARVRESQRRRGVTPPSDKEAMKLAVEEQHVHRGEANGG